MSDPCLLGLLNDLIDAGAQLGIGAAQSFFRWQSAIAALPRAASFLIWLEEASLRQFVSMAMQARQVQIIVARDLRHRLAGGEAAVDFRALEMLTCAAWSSHTRD